MSKDGKRGSWRIKSLRSYGLGLASLVGSAIDEVRGNGASQLPAAAAAQLRKSERVAQWAGVSVRWLMGFWDDVLSGKAKLSAHGARLAEGKAREDWTVSDVCDAVVMPAVAKRKCAFTDTLDKAHVGKPFEGAFVSLARSSRFSDVVAALAAHFSQSQSQSQGVVAAADVPADAFVWLDLFCANQPLLALSTGTGASGDKALATERAELLARGLHEALAHFEERLFFLDSWLAPTPLKRLWCVWELFGAAESGLPTAVVLPPAERAKFVGAVLEDPADFMAHIADARPDQAECAEAGDLAAIATAVEAEGGPGWAAVQQVVSEQLTAWVQLEAEATVRRAAAEPGSTEAAAFGDLLIQTGGLMWLSGDGEVDIALSYYNKAEAVYAAAHGSEECAAVADVLNNKAVLFEAMGQDGLDDALEAFTRSLDILTAVHGAEHATMVSVLENMAGVHLDLGRPDRAAEATQRALDMAVAVHGAGHPRVGELMVAMGNLHRAAGDTDRALEVLQGGLDLFTAAHGPQHLSCLEALTAMAVARGEAGQLDEALGLYQQCLDMRVALSGIDHVGCAETLHGMASIKRAQGKLKEALALYKKAAAYDAQDQLSQAYTLNDLALVHAGLGDFDQAMQCLRHSLALKVAAFGSEEHTGIAGTLMNIANVYEAMGKYDLAIQSYERSLNIELDAYGGDHVSIAQTLFNLGTLQQRMDLRADALANAEKALDIWKRHLPADSDEIAEAKALVRELKHHK